jgi:hypothetical protein
MLSTQPIRCMYVWITRLYLYLCSTFVLKESFANVLCSKIIHAVNSIGFCQAHFDEGDTRKGLGGSDGHVVIIPSLSHYGT